MKERVIVLRWLVISILAVAFVAALSTAAYCCGKQVVLERDWMSGYKPDCGEFVNAMNKCDWEASITDDDSSCTHCKYLDNAEPSPQEYVNKCEDMAVPAGKHKVHLLGADLSNSDPEEVYYGICWHGGEDDDYAAVCVTECGGSGTTLEKSTDNHEIGHEFECGACSQATCCMNDDTETAVYFCTSGENHANKVRTTNP